MMILERAQNLKNKEMIQMTTFLRGDILSHLKAWKKMSLMLDLELNLLKFEIQSTTKNISTTSMQSEESLKPFRDTKRKRRWLIEGPKRI